MIRSVIGRSWVCAVLLLAQSSCTDSSGPESGPPRFKIAISAFDGAVHVTDETGLETAVISCGQNCRLFHPQWSRDAKYLAMIGYDANRYSILFISDADGRNLREITRVASIPMPFIHGTTRFEANYYDQTWSKSGRLAYFKRDTIFQLLPGAASPTIVKAGLAGNWLNWLPRDTALSFEAGSLKVVNVATGAVRQIGPFTDHVTAHDWAPDGSSALISVAVPDTTTLYKVDVQTGSVKKVARHSFLEVPCWSDDSKSFAYVASNYGDRNRLYVADALATTPREVLASLKAVGTEAFWVERSQWLIALSNSGFALTDVVADSASFIPINISLNGFAVSSSRCGRMFYLLPDGW